MAESGNQYLIGGCKMCINDRHPMHKIALKWQKLYIILNNRQCMHGT